MIVTNVPGPQFPLYLLGAKLEAMIPQLPLFQNQGLSHSLISPILEQADRAGVTTFLETFTPRNESFYQRLGYRVAGKFFEPTIAANYSLMVRE